MASADEPRRHRPSLGGLFGSARDRLLGALHTWPLSVRLIAILVALLTIALTLTSVATGARMRSYLIDRTNEELRVAAEPVAQKLLSQVDLYRRTVTGLPSSYAVVFMDEQGEPLVEAYPSDGRFQPDIPKLSREDPRVRNGQPFTVGSRLGEVNWQVLAGPLDDERGTYAVAASLRGAEKTVTQIQAVITVIGLVMVLACVLAGWFGIRRAFRPLRSIEDTAAAIAAGDLTRRIPQHAAQDELASLSQSLNAMLSQVETSFAVREASEERMRRFVADASHELRTPLATIRGYAELYRQGAVPTPEATAGAMRRIEGEASRMGGLVEDLLLLARMDDRRPVETGQVDLTVLASDAVQDARARDPQRSIRMSGLGEAPIEPAVVHGVEAQLRQVVTNLLANAMHHTPAGTSVEVAVGRPVAGRVRLVVTDHGPGIDPANSARVFERFYRGDPARGRQEGIGTGLGLAIVAAIVEAHHGRVGVEPTLGGGATFIVDLPADAEHPQSPPRRNPESPYIAVVH